MDARHKAGHDQSMIETASIMPKRRDFSDRRSRTHARNGIRTSARQVHQALRRVKALRLHRTIRRDVGSAMAACVSSWVKVREIVSMVRPR